MMIRIADLDVGDFFTVDGVTYIKLENAQRLNDSWYDLAINRDPLTSVDITKKSDIMTLSQRIFGSVTNNSKHSCYTESKMIDIRAFAKYKDLILPHVHDCWFVEWTNKAQGHNGDCCCIDENGSYCVVNENKKNELINGNGKLNIRTLCWFDPDTIVEV